MEIKEALPIGTILDSGKRKYAIKSVLGQGGFGITYLATSTIYVDNIPFETQFAIKEHYISSMNERQGATVSVSNANNTEEIKESIDSFLVEAQRLNRLSLNHSGLVRVNESFRANGTAYYVMEYIKGQSLREYVRHSPLGRLPEAEALQLFKPVTETIGYLHDNKVTHLDIKPDNILIRENGEPVVIDFGLSKHYNSKGTPTSTIKAAGCSSGYSPMEQYAGITTFTPEADVYALSATLLYMLTGKDPMISTEINSDIIRHSLPNDVSTGIIESIVMGMKPLKSDRTISVHSIIDNSKNVVIRTSRNDRCLDNETKPLIKREGQKNSIYHRKTTILVFTTFGIIFMLLFGVKAYLNKPEFLYDYSRLQIGDYIYSDGSFSHKKVTSKECVGCVYNLTTTDFEQKQGYTHGHIVALSDVRTDVEWSIGGEDLKNNQVYSTFSMARKEKDGLINCTRESISNSFAAMSLSNNYNIVLPDGFSNWYLPAIGEWCDIIENIGNTKIKEISDGTHPSEGSYWDSFENVNTALEKKINVRFWNNGIGEYYWSSTQAGNFYMTDTGKHVPVTNGHVQNSYSCAWLVSGTGISPSSKEQKCHIRAVAAF